MKTTLAKLIGKGCHLLKFSNGYVGELQVTERKEKGSRLVIGYDGSGKMGTYEGSCPVEILLEKTPATLENPTLSSGQQFTDAQGKKWTLQKLPDFNAWLLIGQDRGDGTFDRWFGPATSALGAFGGCFAEFTFLTEK